MATHPDMSSGDRPCGGRGPLLRLVATAALCAGILTVPAFAVRLRPNPATEVPR